jgi:hypothetical protein
MAAGLKIKKGNTCLDSKTAEEALLKCCSHFTLEEPDTFENAP